MNKLTALIEAAKAATPGAQSAKDWMVGQAQFHHLANPVTILELCALLEMAEEALEHSWLERSHETLTAIQKWNEKE